MTPVSGRAGSRVLAPFPHAGWHQGRFLRHPVTGTLLVADADPVELARSGYNAISRAYRGDDDPAPEHDAWLALPQERIPRRGRARDIGCGCGIPVARRLAAAGHRVTGADISDAHIERARRLVPGAAFLRADATDASFPPGTFDAVVCLHALIHMPLDRQPRLLRDIARWLRPGGWLLATTGHDAWTGSADNWPGGPATMWWSHAGAGNYRTWLGQAGLQVADQQFAPEADSGHALFWAQRKADGPAQPPTSGNRHTAPGVTPGYRRSRPWCQLDEQVPTIVRRLTGAANRHRSW